jgi:AbrB family looped-hinge helix DNA binding protein
MEIIGDGVIVPTRVKVDRQGRIVIPLSERERLGVAEGGFLEMIATAEGLLIEPRRSARVEIAADGLPVIRMAEGEEISNDESLEAIRRERDRL